MIDLILNGIGSIIAFIDSIWNLFLSIITIVPQPFGGILNSYIAIACLLLMWKVYKGG